ncbi:PA2779 family protein [Desulfopila inferna]|uniref:PA2779 family protein n=1 Tax=Desulfopila inferna TaxID=468528 RepID=UPI001965A168|nr:PA2779 family protein [Desulfopila inferna]MBM9603654.1 PA2779 family protein [Desulfopila inferna]
MKRERLVKVPESGRRRVSIYLGEEVVYMHGTIYRIFIGFLMAAFLCTSSLVPTAQAAVIDTSVYLDQAQNISTDELTALLERQDVQEQLVTLGVDPTDARQRIASLSEAELRRLQQGMDELPAGSSVLAVLGVVLVVLIVLEILGVTNIFTRL